jgi:acetaldehyde dehydrogenase/alcohol dehydrogenase
LTRFAPSTSVDQIVDSLVEQAHAAQRLIERWSEDRIDALLSVLANTVADHAYGLAVATVEETGMGNVHDKTFKNTVASVSVYERLAGQIGHGEISFDRERRVAEIASPVGVVVGLVPATHPVATFIFKVLIALKGRNAIILCPSRRAQRVSQRLGRLIQRELRVAGAPRDLVQWTPAGSGRDVTTDVDESRGRRARARDRWACNGPGRVSVRQTGDWCGAGECPRVDQC